MKRLGRGLLSACVRRCLVKPVLRVSLPSAAALAYRSVHGAAAGAAAVKRAALSTLMRGAVFGAIVSSAACAGAADASAPDAKKPRSNSILTVNLPGYAVPQSVAVSNDNELEAWKKTALIESSQADHWAGQLNGKDVRFKRMARVARSVLSLPNVSAECERDFSAAKALLTSQRKSMLPDTLARKMFLVGNRRLWVANPGVQLPS